MHDSSMKSGLAVFEYSLLAFLGRGVITLGQAIIAQGSDAAALLRAPGVGA